MFRKILIANRGVIACRIIRTLRRLGVSPIAVYSEADRHSSHVAQADAAILLGPSAAAESYLNQAAILEAARQSGAQAIHPGYGFLSENADFAEACEESGIVFLGPTPKQIRALGLKHTAREIAKREGTPLLPGSALLIDKYDALKESARCGYPIILKITAGGGGFGMCICRNRDETGDYFDAVTRLSMSNFGQDGVYLERFVEKARHVEVQIFGDGTGRVLALGERDCSAQRRTQKVIEETPAPGLSADVRRRLWETAETLGRAVAYRSAGTVEYLYDSDTEEFFFLEVNTRLQVEHGITEEATGVDLVEWMVRLGCGELQLPERRPELRGVSIQARIYAEDPAHDFRPGAGVVTNVQFPEAIRCETWIQNGTEVTPYYDPMIANIIVHADTRELAVSRLRMALDGTRLDGLETNLDYLRQVVMEPEFLAGGFPTSFLNRVTYRPRAFEVLDAGTQTTVQAYPGRVGYWHVGVPPSGPMDSLAFRLANRLVGNPEGEAALECTMIGPALKFFSDAVVAIGGAEMKAALNGIPVQNWRPIQVSAGSILKLSSARDAGTRAYIAVRGGIDVPEYLGSRATFVLGRFGGHAGRTLIAGDVLRWRNDEDFPAMPGPVPDHLVPRYSHQWEIGVLYGPHGSPDFFTAGDIRTLFSATWKVHYNSDRTGVRLIGPRPEWARKDGGEAGLHPSSLHDNAYAIGALAFTGDMPVILGPDGPSLGGFVCPAVIVQAELWKVGQLSPGDSVIFRAISEMQARQMELQLDRVISDFEGDLPEPALDIPEPAVLAQDKGTVYRTSGDRYLLIELGPNVLDLNLRFRIHALEAEFRRQNLAGILDITPGIRSLQIHYDSRILPRESLIECLAACEKTLPPLENITLPTRIVNLPLSWDDPATRLAIQKYTQSVRPDAPWCPSNIEFIRRINGLDSIEDVQEIVFNSDYLVMGLGDVYLGAPVATPLDPRHRLVTTRYNPARTWTAENSVGIGGAYMCVYGMEGPGGSQFVGRTLQMWNTYGTSTPWLLRFFDQIRFFPVSAGELLEIRDAFPHGKYDLQIESNDFNLGEYNSFLRETAGPATRFKETQQAAFLAERERWAAAGQAEFVSSSDDVAPVANTELPEGCEAVRSPMMASVWQVAVEPGQRVGAGERIAVLEAMKMEFLVVAPSGGIVECVHCAKGGMVTAGQNLATLRVG